MATDSRYFGRVYSLTLSEPGGGETKVFEAKEGTTPLDIKFDINYARGQTAREGTVSILGLSYPTISKFISLAAKARGAAMKELARVRLEVGYMSGAGTIEVIDGFVWYATVTAPPQMWLNLKVCEYNPLGAPTTTFPDISVTTVKKTMDTILEKFHEVEGVEFKLIDKTEDQLVEKENKAGTNIEINFGAKEKVSLSDVINKFNMASSTMCFTLRKNRKSNVREVEAHDKKDKATSGNIYVDKDHGLLSVTGIDAVNGCITTFIDGQFADELSHMVLTSQLNPHANGRYYITRKQYVGHYQGPEWYVRYYCSAREGDKPEN